uniref:Uncharacterized protein n=1 Tax=Brassica oleracea TaxID=3712 RepID=A0A3P6CUU9_BRAOL|nr:unnamed protein product [Brassica oleracea]
MKCPRSVDVSSGSGYSISSLGPLFAMVFVRMRLWTVW